MLSSCVLYCIGMYWSVIYCFYNFFYIYIVQVENGFSLRGPVSHTYLYYLHTRYAQQYAIVDLQTYFVEGIHSQKE